jgi:hypothetical protein
MEDEDDMRAEWSIAQERLCAYKNNDKSFGVSETIRETESDSASGSVSVGRKF